MSELLVHHKLVHKHKACGRLEVYLRTYVTAVVQERVELVEIGFYGCEFFVGCRGVVVEQVGFLYVDRKIIVCRPETVILVVVAVELEHISQSQVLVNIHAVVAESYVLGEHIAALILSVYI